jgi:hypothetical protein
VIVEVAVAVAVVVAAATAVVVSELQILVSWSVVCRSLLPLDKKIKY